MSYRFNQRMRKEAANGWATLTLAFAHTKLGQELLNLGRPRTTCFTVSWSEKNVSIGRRQHLSLIKGIDEHGRDVSFKFDTRGAENTARFDNLEDGKTYEIEYLGRDLLDVVEIDDGPYKSKYERHSTPKAPS